MKTKTKFYLLASIFLVLFFIRGLPFGETTSICRASYSYNVNRGSAARGYSSLLEWVIDINNKNFYITVDRTIETVIIRGVVDRWDEAERVEEIIRLRAPNTYRIINAIVINY